MGFGAPRLPGVPRNVIVTNTTTSSISLAWEEPEDTGTEDTEDSQELQDLQGLYGISILDLNIGCTEKDSQKTYRMRILAESSAESSAHCSDLCLHCKIVPFHLFVRVDT